MHGVTVLGVYRERIFSPGKVLEDAKILDTTLDELVHQRFEARVLEAANLEVHSPRPACVLSMAQSDRTLSILENWSEGGTRIINTPQSVRNCYRKLLIQILAMSNVPVPFSRTLPVEEVEQALTFGSETCYWLKRGDVHAMQSADVVRVDSRESLLSALTHFRHQKCEVILVQEHVEGQVIKFYGVGPGEYFSAFLPSSGEELTSQVKMLVPVVEQSAEAVGLEVYGGDAILTPKGGLLLIDLNDWPSFSRCCVNAAKSIARYIKRVCDGGTNGSSDGCKRG